MSYYYEGNGVWRSGSSNAVHIGPDEPINDSMLWVDDEDEEIEENFGSDILNQLKVVLGDMNAKIEKVEYALTMELDPGYFGGKMPGEDDEIEEEAAISRAIYLPGEAVDPEYPP